MSNLQTYYHFTLDFQEVDQHTYISKVAVGCQLKCLHLFHCNIDGLEQDCSNSVANALKLQQFCTLPSTWSLSVQHEVKHCIDSVMGIYSQTCL